MKKLCIALIVFFLTVSFGFAQSFLPKGTYRSPFKQSTQNKTDTDKRSSARSRYAVIPTIGYGKYSVLAKGSADVMLFGLDFMYAAQSGFAVWFNNTFFAGQGIVPVETYDRYGSRSGRNRSASVGGWSGELLLGYSKEIGKHTIGIGGGFQAALGGGDELLVEVGAFAIHVDYSYFFTEKIGMGASITDGLGGGSYGTFSIMNAFSLKAGPVIKI